MGAGGGAGFLALFGAYGLTHVYSPIQTMEANSLLAASCALVVTPVARSDFATSVRDLWLGVGLAWFGWGALLAHEVHQRMGHVLFWRVCGKYVATNTVANRESLLFGSCFCGAGAAVFVLTTLCSKGSRHDKNRPYDEQRPFHYFVGDASERDATSCSIADSAAAQRIAELEDRLRLAEGLARQERAELQRSVASALTSAREDAENRSAERFAEIDARLRAAEVMSEISADEYEDVAARHGGSALGSTAGESSADTSIGIMASPRCGEDPVSSHVAAWEGRLRSSDTAASIPAAAKVPPLRPHPAS